MKLVQVIAGLDERLFMNRPVIQDMLEQFDMCPLLGLDHIFEVLKDQNEPHYHCALCNLDSNMLDLVSHITSINHTLIFLKEFFPAAWSRFSTTSDHSKWKEADFDCLETIVSKIDSVHGR